ILLATSLLLGLAAQLIVGLQPLLLRQAALVLVGLTLLHLALPARLLVAQASRLLLALVLARAHLGVASLVVGVTAHLRQRGPFARGHDVVAPQPVVARSGGPHAARRAHVALDRRAG